tara:strand:- start:276 stop:1385 length:1110 start_codon:yes stop_codon:yes gene_type:complete
VDASLVVGVCNDLFSAERRPAFVADLKVAQEKARKRFAEGNSGDKKLLSLVDAREQGFKTDWTQVDIAKPSRLGVKVVKEFDLATIAEYIDWSPFFWTWQLKGSFPSILEHKKYGEQAREIYEEAQRLMKDIIANKRFKLRAVSGLWAAQSNGDSVSLYEDESLSKSLGSFHFLRQQAEKQSDSTYYSLADFIAPESSGRVDYIGGFAVTAGFELEEYATGFKDSGDDYTAIMIQALGDRFAEALAEYVHKNVRDDWGFGESEGLSVEECIKEKYRGIRPAAGYPACPDHTEKDLLWTLLDAEKATTIALTESYAMNPPSSVSGLYFAHPDARYFNVGKLDKDQIEDYAARKGFSVEKTEKWLQTNLAY